MANCIGILAKGQNLNEDFALYTDMIRDSKKEIDNRTPQEVKESLKDKVNNGG